MIDQWVSAVAVAQAIWITLQAGAKLVEHHIAIPTPWPPIQMEGPKILPETNQALFDLTEAFRYAVKLGLRSDEYQDPNSFDLSLRKPPPAAEPYRMSLTSCNSVSSSSSFLPSSSDRRSENQQQKKQKQQQQQHLIEYTTLQDGDIISKSSIMELLEEPISWDKKAGLLGIPFASVSSAQPHQDFDVVLTATLPAKHNLQTATTAKIKAFAPETFVTLRNAFGIDEELFHHVLLQSGPYVSFQANSKGSARSGGVFFFTSNGSFLIKTIQTQEAATLLEVLLPRYHEYMVTQQGGRTSLINRICGVYRVALPPPSRNNKVSLSSSSSTSTNNSNEDFSEEYTFIVLNSVFPPNVRLHERFDLKGSTLGRKASTSESVLKDLDLLFMMEDNKNRTNVPQHHRRGLVVGQTTKQALMEQLHKDVGLLRSCSLIDYSLLVGISLATSTKPTNHNNNIPLILRMARRIVQLLLATSKGPSHHHQLVNAGKFAVIEGFRNGIPALYYLGLIDFLQPFNTRKLAEYHLKSLVYNRHSFSCIPPTPYADRFLDFMVQNIH